jgi:hypothetical protein
LLQPPKPKMPKARKKTSVVFRESSSVWNILFCNWFVCIKRLCRQTMVGLKCFFLTEPVNFVQRAVNMVRKRLNGLDWFMEGGKRRSVFVVVIRGRRGERIRCRFAVSGGRGRPQPAPLLGKERGRCCGCLALDSGFLFEYLLLSLVLGMIMFY